MLINFQKRLWIILLFFSFAFATITSSVGKADPMKFHGRPPPSLPMFAGTAWYVFADGDIDENSGAQLLQFLRASKVPKRSLIFLNSRGGSLLGGMNLGKVIRQHELFSYVGIDKKQDEYRTTSPGECY